MKGAVQQLYNPEYRAIGNLSRLWFHTQYLTPKGERFGQVTLSPNWKAFPHPVGGIQRGDLDTYLQRLKDRGISVMAAMANAYNEQFSVPLKSVPKDNPSLSKTDPNSYKIYRKILQQTALRYGSVQNDSLIDIAEWGNTPQNPQVKKSGLNTIEYMQIGNEWNKYNGKPASAESLTGAEYADLLNVLSNDIWFIDSRMKIIAAPTARFDEAWLSSFYDRSIQLGNDFGDLISISLNIYLFGSCGYSSTVKCNVVKPEDSPLFEQVNNWCKDRNLKYFITEHGCNSEKIFDLGYPQYDGLNNFQSQAKFIIDSTNRWLSMSHCVGATFYQLVDDPNEPRFEHTGLFFKDSTTDPSEKQSYPIVKQAFSQETPIPPTPTTMKAYHSNNPQRIGQVEITSTSVLTPGNFTIEIKDVLPAIELQLKKDGLVVVARRPEGQAPLDLLGSNPDGTAKLYNAGSGNYELTVWKNNVPTVFIFKVQAVVPPQPVKKPVTTDGKVYIQDGRVYFQTADLLYSTQVSQV